MKVILLENVTNLGNVGDCVDVKAGFARNFLIPQEKATPATAANLAEFELRRGELEKKAADVLTEAERRAETLKPIQLVIKAQASDEGKLFGSVTPRDIADAFTQQHQHVAKKEITMPEGPIRTTGEHTIRLHLHSAVQFELTINVEPEA